ncbi:MAG: hypothetical protein ACE5IO_07610 [Thermoplasmata archaeon]
MPSDIDRFASELQKDMLWEVRKKYSQVVVKHWMSPSISTGWRAMRGMAVLLDPVEILWRST